MTLNSPDKGSDKQDPQNQAQRQDNQTPAQAPDNGGQAVTDSSSETAPEKQFEYTKDAQRAFLQQRTVTFSDKATIEQMNVYLGDKYSDKETKRLLKNTGELNNVQLISMNEIQRVASVYIAPQNYQQAKALMNQNRVIILKGDKGIGKYASAIRLALDPYGAGNIYELNLIQRFDQLLEVELDKEACYIFDNLQDYMLRESSPILRMLSKQLEQKGSYLLLTTESTTHYTDLQNYMLALNVMQSNEVKIQLVENHLEHFSDGNSDLLKDARRLFKEPEVQNLLAPIKHNERLGALAVSLIETTKGKMVLADVLLLFQQNDASNRSQWLESITDPYEQSFLISMSVFSNCRTEHIQQASNKIIEENMGLFGLEEGKNTLRSLQSTRTTYQKMRIRPRFIETHDKGSRVRIETLQFEPGTSHLDVLDYFWDNFPPLREPLCEWLYQIGMAGVVDNSLRQKLDKVNSIRELFQFFEEIQEGHYLTNAAAVAAGHLATRHQREMLQGVIQRWVDLKATNPLSEIDTQVSVVFLQMIYENKPQNGTIVLEIINSWLKKSRSYEKTAVIVYGYIGMYYPNEALHQLIKILKNKPYLKLEVRRALFIMFGWGYENYPLFFRVLHTLLTMCKSANKDLTAQQRDVYRECALRAFLDISEYHKWMTSGLERVPAILQLARKDVELREIIVELFCGALWTPITRRQMLHVFKRYCHLVDKETALQRTLDSLIRRMMRTNKELCEELKGYFYLWTFDGKEGSQFVRRYLEEDC